MNRRRKAAKGRNTTSIPTSSKSRGVAFVSKTNLSRTSVSKPPIEGENPRKPFSNSKRLKAKPDESGVSLLTRDQKKESRPSRLREAYFVSGQVKRHPDGFGFLVPDEANHVDVYLPRSTMVGVMSNDKVKVKVYPGDNPDRLSGEVAQVLHRATTVIMGRFRRKPDGSATIVDDESNWGVDMVVKVDDQKQSSIEISKVPDGSLVVARITTYPGEKEKFAGKIVEILGDGTDPLYDTRKVIFSHQIPTDFSPKTLKEVSHLSPTVDERDFRNRKDLRRLNFVTIDGATAKDFDDAVYVERTSQGFQLWVGIADVSHYVKPDSTLDQDAYQRGTSVYFPNHVVPMLPEILSNELCSLRPHIPRLSFVCEMKISFSGHLESYKFYEAVIESKSRVTYGEAQEVLDGRALSQHSHVADSIRVASDLAKILMAKRFREGALDLNIPETQVLLNEVGVPIDIIKSERLFSHRLIEELMLITNVATALFFDDHKIPGIYRIHEEPALDNIETLNSFLTSFGGTQTITGGKIQRKISKALEQFSGKPQFEILNILTLRSMKQARYSATNIGHFGLGFSHYSHFTSPIRRYPDLIAHRLIKSILYPQLGYQKVEIGDLESAGTFLSACEQRSTKAERQFNSIKRARFMTPMIGEEFDGVISSVTRFGVFVLLKMYDVDGLIKIENLGGEYFEFDEDRLSLTGRTSGHSYQIGDSVKVVVVSTNPDQGQIDFGLAGCGSDRDHPRSGKVRSKSKRSHPAKGTKKSRRSKKRR